MKKGKKEKKVKELFLKIVVVTTGTGVIWSHVIAHENNNNPFESKEHTPHNNYEYAFPTESPSYSSTSDATSPTYTGIVFKK